MFLIAGCGKHKKKEKDHINLDVISFPNVDVVHNLNIIPWPFEDSYFLHVSAVHVVEHLNSLVDFMNEAWRVLQPGGSLLIKTPLAGADPDLEWADPTHKRCYRIHTFVNYFSPEGVNVFGYTDKAWNFFHLRAKHNVITAHAYPIKKD
jgi:predicted SAM-dependent methyltransferase